MEVLRDGMIDIPNLLRVQLLVQQDQRGLGGWVGGEVGGHTPLYIKDHHLGE